MRQNKGLYLIIFGGLLALFAIVNLFIDIPDLIASYNFQRSQITNQTSSGPSLQIQDEGQKLPLAETLPNEIKEAEPLEKRVIVTPNPTELPSMPVEVIKGYVPDRIIIPAIGLDAPITQSTYSTIELRDGWFEQWNVPDEFAAGWQTNSAPLSAIGNTVIGGHHNEYGKVFSNLYKLEPGDIIYVFSGGVTFTYKVAEIQLLKEKDVSLEIRKENAKWISPGEDERLTLVTCWPKRSNTHRLIIVAEPFVEAQSG